MKNPEVICGRFGSDAASGTGHISFSRDDIAWPGGLGVLVVRGYENAVFLIDFHRTGATNVFDDVFPNYTTPGIDSPGLYFFEAPAGTLEMDIDFDLGTGIGPGNVVLYQV